MHLDSVEINECVLTPDPWVKRR